MDSVVISFNELRAPTVSNLTRQRTKKDDRLRSAAANMAGGH